MAHGCFFGCHFWSACLVLSCWMDFGVHVLQPWLFFDIQGHPCGLCKAGRFHALCAMTHATGGHAHAETICLAWICRKCFTRSFFEVCTSTVADCPTFAAIIERSWFLWCEYTKPNGRSREKLGLRRLHRQSAHSLLKGVPHWGLGLVKRDSKGARGHSGPIPFLRDSREDRLV